MLYNIFPWLAFWFFFFYGIFWSVAVPNFNVIAFRYIFSSVCGFCIFFKKTISTPKSWRYSVLFLKSFLQFCSLYGFNQLGIDFYVWCEAEGLISFLFYKHCPSTVYQKIHSCLNNWQPLWRFNSYLFWSGTQPVKTQILTVFLTTY